MTEETHLSNKIRLYNSLYDLCRLGRDGLSESLSDIYCDNLRWRGSHPFNDQCRTGLEEQVLTPLFDSFEDLERRDLIVMGGNTGDRDYVACLGHYCGTFVKSWLTIPPTGKTIYIRYGEVYRIDKDRGKVCESWCLWDILDVMMQSGFRPLSPSLGVETMWPGPITADGLIFYQTDKKESRFNLEKTLEMHQALANHDDDKELSFQSLMSSDQEFCWHENMMWYGPCGIGTTRGLKGFVLGHQLPFRRAFPNRLGGKQWERVPDKMQKHGGGHYINIGDGKYTMTGGWPSVIASHKGGNFLGVAPTGREVTMRVMDFYLIHENKIRENWVPIDILDLLLQMDVDVFDRMQYIFSRGGVS